MKSKIWQNLGLLFLSHQGYNFRDFSNKLDLIYLENLFLPLVNKGSINLRDSIQELKEIPQNQKQKQRSFILKFLLSFYHLNQNFSVN